MSNIDLYEVLQICWAVNIPNTKHSSKCLVLVLHRQLGNFVFFMSCPDPPMWISSMGSFPIWSTLRILFPPVKLCLYGCINWPLAQPHQESSLGLSQFSTNMWHTRDKQKAGFRFYVQKQLVLESGDAFLAEKSCLDTRTENQGGRLGMHLPVPLTLEGRVAIGYGAPDVL